VAYAHVPRHIQLRRLKMLPLQLGCDPVRSTANRANAVGKPELRPLSSHPCDGASVVVQRQSAVNVR
jgi:hypothetical protein